MKKIFIQLISNSLGDTIAATPYVCEYQKKHNVNVSFGINDSYIFLLNELQENQRKY